MNEEEYYKTYLTNFFNTVEEICISEYYPIIRRNSIPNALVGVENFEKGNSDIDVRRGFLNYVIENIENATIQIKDLKNYDEKEKILYELKQRVYKIFPDIKIDKRIVLDVNEKVILLQYLGILKHLSDSKYTQKTQYELLSFILERSPINIKKAISQINGKITENNSVRNRKTLNKVKKVIEITHDSQLLSKIQSDMDELDNAK